MRNLPSLQEPRWKIIYSDTRRDTIKQIEVLLSIIDNRDSKEYRVLVDYKNVLEYLTDREFIKYVYNQSDPDRVSMYIHMVSNDLTAKIPARRMVMYSAAIYQLLEGANQTRIDRLGRLIEMLNSISDQEYINMVMDVVCLVDTITDTLSTVLRKYGLDMINELKEK